MNEIDVVREVPDLGEGRRARVEENTRVDGSAFGGGRAGRESSCDGNSRNTNGSSSSSSRSGTNNDGIINSGGGVGVDADASSRGGGEGSLLCRGDSLW